MKKLENKRKKILILSAIKLLSFIGLFILGFSQEAKTLRGALSKNGNHYVLRWENSDQSVGIKTFESPLSAIDFAETNLKLRPGSNSKFYDSLENLWVRREMGKQVVFWKTFGFDKVHRMTFTNESHARFFESSFRGGAYSPSPIGHAVYLVKASVQ